MGIIIKGGKIVTSTDVYEADIRIVGEKIASIGHDLNHDGDEVVDARGCMVMPGGIDPHTHFNLDVGSTKTADDFYSGTKAALLGGTTTIIDFAHQIKGQSLKEALNNHFKKTKKQCFCDYGD